MTDTYRSPNRKLAEAGNKDGYPVYSAITCLFAFALMMYFFDDLMFSDSETYEYGINNTRMIVYVSFLIPLVIVHQLLSFFLSASGSIFLKNGFIESFYKYQKLGYSIITLGLLAYLFFGIGRKAALF